ncbi:MAG: ABC transporter permease [Bacteroidetes bacterium]|nr:ABC transporter permease [Bacteroidota bacterium]
MGDVVYRFYVCTWDEAIIMLKRGQAQLILRDHPQKLSYHFDPVSAEGKPAYLQLSTALNHDQIRDETGVIKPLKIVGTRYIDFLVPGLIAMGVMSAIMWGISYDLIDKRAKKLLRRMIATPMKRSELLLSHFFARLLLSLVESMLIFLFANLYFGISVTGSRLALFMVMIAGNIRFTGIAIFISSRTARTEIGNGLINAVTMPMMVLSGIFFSYHHFPEGAIPFIQALPLTMLADGLRSIFLEGAGLLQIIAPTALLTGIGVTFFAIGLKIYKWH